MADHMTPEPFPLYASAFQGPAPAVGSIDPIGNVDVRVDSDPVEDSDCGDDAGYAEDTLLPEDNDTLGSTDHAEDTVSSPNVGDVGAATGNAGCIGNFGPVHPSVNERSRRRAYHLREIYRAQLARERMCTTPDQPTQPAKSAHSPSDKRSTPPSQQPTSRCAASRYDADEELNWSPIPSPLPSLVGDVLAEISLTFNDEFSRSSRTRAARLYAAYVQGVNRVNDAYSVKDPAQAFAAILTALFNRLRNHRFLRKTSQGLPNGMPLFFTELEQQVRDICKRVAYHRQQEAVQHFQSACSQAQARLHRQSSPPPSYSSTPPAYEMPASAAAPVDYTEPEPYMDYAQSYDDPFDDGPTTDGPFDGGSTTAEGQIVMSPAQQRTADDPPCPNVRFSVREMSAWYVEQYHANLTIGELIRLGQHYGANLTEAQIAAICATPADDALIRFTIETIRINAYYDMLDNFVAKGLA